MGVIAILDGLQAAIAAAVANTITRPVTVLNREPDGTYERPFPMILITPVDTDARTINSGQLGQDSAHPALYGLVIFDQVKKVAGATGQIAASQSDVFALLDAITAYFAVKANKSLPNHSAMSVRSVRFRMDPYGMYKRSDAGIGPVALGVVGVIGRPQPENP